MQSKNVDTVTQALNLFISNKYEFPSRLYLSGPSFSQPACKLGYE